MHQLAEQYAQAIHRLSLEEYDENTIVNGLLALLTDKGHQSLLPSILREYEKLTARDARKRVPHLIVASTKDVEQSKKALKAYIEEATAEPTITIDENLVGGFIFQYGDLFVDSSFKARLLTLYRNIIRT